MDSTIYLPLKSMQQLIIIMVVPVMMGWCWRIRTERWCLPTGRSIMLGWNSWLPPSRKVHSWAISLQPCSRPLDGTPLSIPPMWRGTHLGWGRGVASWISTTVISMSFAQGTGSIVIGRGRGLAGAGMIHYQGHAQCTGTLPILFVLISCTS